MNKMLVAAVCFSVHSSWAQMSHVEPKSGEPPPKSFSNVIPAGSAWTVTMKSRSELTAKKDKSSTREVATFSPTAHLIVKRIEYAYAAGIRREIFHYGDNSFFTRYVTPNAVLFEDRASGNAIIDSPADSMSGQTYGTDRLGELKWVSDKFYLGVADYNGRPCYVYRNYASQIAQTDGSSDLNQERPEPIATAKGELRDLKNARIEATAFIDKFTMRPVALETMYGTQLYDWSPVFQPYDLPTTLAKAERDRIEALAKRKQRYSISQ